MEQKIKIRTAVETDAPAIAEIYRPYVEETVYTFETVPPDGPAFIRRLQETQPDFPWLAAERDGRLLGYAYASRAFARAAYDWAADLSIYLREEARGCGLGRALYQVLEGMLKKQGYHVLYGLVTSENESSCRFHESMGYRLAATMPFCGFKHGRWLGIHWYEKRLCPPDPPKARPVPASQTDWTGLELTVGELCEIELN